MGMEDPHPNPLPGYREREESFGRGRNPSGEGGILGEREESLGRGSHSLKGSGSIRMSGDAYHLHGLVSDGGAVALFGGAGDVTWCSACVGAGCGI
jgi:hypothetical protein